MKLKNPPWPVVLILFLASLVVLVFRLQLSGSHRSQLSRLLGRPMPKALVMAVYSGNAPLETVYYLYSEECPYCAMDHLRVRRASMAAPRPVVFAAISLGHPPDQVQYWSDPSGGPPDKFGWIEWSVAAQSGISGVPMLVVVRGGMIRAAWSGHLQWTESEIRHAIACRLGAKWDCIALYATNTKRGLGRSVSAMSARLGLGHRVESGPVRQSY